ncbi:sigma-70 RNA polymerase sigma factor region 4 domain-containing protein [Anaeromicropila populeti]|uniref:RNA polymerase sigma factor, sigma-70 family n=1 Tax=Anaeromicropila populeti TaxID=37658 RepID=A0A1I6LDD9_9FIRM|nr:sigma-70 family RNA polymerase sigma factor [Anaeromicropila populeti]SFS01522.1 RNA polymerase sigma factor, sigma-70 family [Anaeromicropila populeti]
MKERKITVKKGSVVEKVTVSEEVYRAYMQPWWREKQVQKRKRDKEEQLEKQIEVAYEEYAEYETRNGIHMEGMSKSVEELVEENSMLELLEESFSILLEEENHLIRALFMEGLSEREYAGQSGIPRKTISYRKNKILKKLRNWFSEKGYEKR